jgi:hypothetical protein
MLRYATSVYGQDVLVGASWSLIWWFAGAGAIIIVVHATVKAFNGRQPRSGR